MKAKRSSGLAGILAFVILYFLNIGLLILGDYLFIHQIPYPDTNYTAQHEYSVCPDFSEYFDEVLDMGGLIRDDCLVLHRTSDGEVQIVTMDYNDVLNRFHLDKSSAITIPTDQPTFTYEYIGMFRRVHFTV